MIPRARARAGTRASLWCAYAAALALITAFTACSHDNDSDEVDPKDTRVPVTVAPVRRDTLTLRVSLVGRIDAAPGGRALLTAPAAAAVGRVATEVGAPVARGQLLVQLDAPDLAADAASKSAEADAARKEATREEELLREGIAARKDAEQAQATARSAVAAATSADRLLARTHVASPLAGIVDQVFVQPGERVDAGAQLVSVVDMRTVQFEASVPAADLARLRRGQVVTVTAEGTPATRLGTVHAVAPAVDSVTNAGRVIVRLANAGGALRVGAGATAVIDLESRPGVLAVPESALVPGEGGVSVLVVRPDSTVEKRPVRVGIKDGARVEVAGNVRAGERVVTLGGYGLDTGMRVRVTGGRSP